ncbi:hypothetical protein [Leptolyngbya sp. 7M]|uniref:hypothetical protein n=1 Tax=Leptolyngbya sp. 7M TaxID=2812896 RepID=UPI001B8AF890|nr:hypothetical protein [Leptolyngbya sp. 7M]QYO67475.1 hypothetical protein JVX88_12170 [Leptolyngbya sp. 7M]
MSAGVPARRATKRLRYGSAASGSGPGIWLRDLTGRLTGWLTGWLTECLARDVGLDEAGRFGSPNREAAIDWDSHKVCCSFGSLAAGGR